MSFLQPWILYALPLALLPVIIHLVHKRRHRVVEWGAMMFLLDGAKMSRGRQRLREILLLIMRTLAILGLIVGVGRPIAGGWVGAIGGESVGAVVLVIDRSASMSERMASRQDTKLAHGIKGLETALEIAAPQELVVIDSVHPERTLAVQGTDDLRALGLDQPTDAAGDMPAALETALAYLTESNAGRAEVWIVSDGQGSDWRPDDGRWKALAGAMNALPAGVRVRLSLFTGLTQDNLSVRVERARRVSDGGKAELLLDVVVTRSEELAKADDDIADIVPLAIDIAGARTSVDVEFVGREARLQGLRLPIDDTLDTGFGFVELGTDDRPADDRFWFVFGETPTLETLIVSERSDVDRIGSIAASLDFDDSIELASRSLRVDAIETPETLGLAGTAAVLWQAPLPDRQEIKDALDAFIDADGVVLFLPPDAPTDESFRGVSWGEWRDAPAATGTVSPTTWRADDDLLANGDDGTPLPVGEVLVSRWCPQVTDANDDTYSHQALAGLDGGKRLLTRAASAKGGAYFLGTLPTADASNLATQGVVFVALVQRSIALAARTRSSERLRDVGPAEWLTEEWRMASELSGDATLAERDVYAGVVTDSESFIARNRPLSEDESRPQPTEAIREVFGSVDVIARETKRASDGATGVQDEPGLLEEIWRIFLVLALIGLLAEAFLCASEGDAQPVTEGADA